MNSLEKYYQELEHQDYFNMQQQLIDSHNELLEIAEYALGHVRKESVIGTDIAKAITNAKQIKKSTAATADS